MRISRGLLPSEAGGLLGGGQGLGTAPGLAQVDGKVPGHRRIYCHVRSGARKEFLQEAWRASGWSARRRAGGAVVLSPSVGGKQCAGWRVGELRYRPETGFRRDGCCDTDADDAGVHTVCAVVTEEFLRFSVGVGNDLVTPRPEFGFLGLRPGDRWCLCASRWAQAHRAGVAPPVLLAATHAQSLEWIDLADLQRAAVT